ncbi:SAM-dependent methyltransferase [Streptomyces globisporus]|uniref:SAM-dependent methyltransferase n=1 Tax=Streptomyces globisporus TaxID=1908 RepID=UPI003701B11D
MAQGIALESRIVYVDNDPIVLAHAEAFLTSARPRDARPVWTPTSPRRRGGGRGGEAYASATTRVRP